MSTITQTEQTRPDRDVDARQDALQRRLLRPAQRRVVALRRVLAFSPISRATLAERPAVTARAGTSASPSLRSRTRPRGASTLAGLLRRRAVPARLVRVRRHPPRRRRNRGRRRVSRNSRCEAARHTHGLARRSRRGRPGRPTGGCRPSPGDRDRPDVLWDGLEHAELPGGGSILRERSHADRRPRASGRRAARRPKEMRVLGISREPAARLAQPQAPARGRRSCYRSAPSFELYDELKALPPVRRGRRRRGGPPRRRAAA